MPLFLFPCVHKDFYCLIGYTHSYSTSKSSSGFNLDSWYSINQRGEGGRLAPKFLNWHHLSCPDINIYINKSNITTCNCPFVFLSMAVPSHRKRASAGTWRDNFCVQGDHKKLFVKCDIFILHIGKLLLKVFPVTEYCWHPHYYSYAKLL